MNQNLLECQECGNEIFACECKCSSHFYRDKDRLDELLTYCISNARKMLIICSPWITQHASRPIIQQLRAAKNRNAELQIFIFTDDNDENNVRPPEPRNNDIFDIYKRGFVESIREMEEIGAQVYRMSRVHNKSICVDDRIFNRIVHNAHRITLRGESMRKQKSTPLLTGAENGEINQP